MKNAHQKISSSINDVTYQDVLDILDKWEKDEIDREDAFVFAESLFDLAEAGWPYYPDGDKRSVLFGVLESLELMWGNPTLKEDIPALKQFLTMGQTAPNDAWQYIGAYWKGINWDQRRADQFGIEPDDNA